MLVLTGVTLLLFEFRILLRGGRLGRIHVGADGRVGPIIEILLVIVAIDASLALPSLVLFATGIPGGITLLVAVISVLAIVIVGPPLATVAIVFHLG